jgi:UDP:flavonoid glycosyltransferase YjiC (YdhE family)
MKIGMQTWGSHGDVRPMLALAEGLAAAGHEVNLVITCINREDYRQVASRHGVKVTMVASPVIEDAEAAAVGKKVYGERNPIKQFGLIMQLCFKPAEAAMLEAAEQLCQSSDLLIGHFILHPLQIIAERAGRPYASVVLAHSIIPSQYHPPDGMPHLGQGGNRLLWRMFKWLINRQSRHYPQRIRQQLGMSDAQDLLTEIWMSNQLTLVGVSQALCQPQPDWPASLKVCGFLDMDNVSVEGQLPDALDAFLQAGPPPLYITFGSMTQRDIQENRDTFTMLAEATQLAGCRAIIQCTLWQECGFVSSQQVLYIAAAPHHRIFPHCLAVLHHGGAGTTHSATRAGKPSIVVAHINEQYSWGKELQRRGMGPAPILRRKASAKKVAKQIRAVLDQPDIRRHAQAAGDVMRQENGVAAAVKLIEQRFCHPAKLGSRH